MGDRTDYWMDRIEREFIRKPGSHLIQCGITEAGKTQGFFWLVEGIVNCTKNTVVWFDIGKSSEILKLSEFGPLHILTPQGMDVEVKSNLDLDISYAEVADLRDVWDHLIPGRINVISFEPFILDPDVYGPLVGSIFTSLIRKAHRYELQVPMDIIYDEFHRVCPAKGHSVNVKQSKYGAIIQHNVEKLRSFKIRFIVSTHGWNKIRRGVKQSFNWQLIRRGSEFDSGKLKRYNPLWEKIPVDKAFMVFPNMTFSDRLDMHYYGEGEDLGRVYYRGEILDPSEYAGDLGIPGVGGDGDGDEDEVLVVREDILDIREQLLDLQTAIRTQDSDERWHTEKTIVSLQHDLSLLQIQLEELTGGDLE
jgi:hypothetical protein